MQIPVEQLIEGALALPIEARALLADRLVESLDPAKAGSVHDQWAAEAHSRLEDVRTGRVEAVPVDEVIARVRRAVGR